MSRMTKEEVHQKLDAETERANNLHITLAAMKGSLSAATALAMKGHMDVEGLVETVNGIVEASV